MAGTKRPTILSGRADPVPVHDACTVAFSILPPRERGVRERGSSEASFIAPVYVATLFLVTSTGHTAISVLARGGSFAITIASDNSAS
jgi:hypothetical protein